MKRLAVIFPGIGYTADKPLLHYSRRIAERFGYESHVVPYTGFPKKVKGDADKMRKSCEIALTQAKEVLSDLDLMRCEDVLFIGKSIGTVAAAAIASQHPARARIRSVVYTPLEQTFSFALGDAVVFTGSGDPWVGGEKSRIPALCEKQRVPCHVIREANHSLETKDPQTDIHNLQKIMELTADFIRKEQLRRISQYESFLRELQKMISEAEPSASALRKGRKTAERLSRYLDSDDWKLDFADDEKGLLPQDLPRGVLSEDGIYNVLEAFRDLLKMKGVKP